MSLTAGRGPLSPDPAGWYSAPVPRDLVYVEPHPRRIRALLGGSAVIDSEAAVLVHRAGRPLAYAFPAHAVDGLRVEPVTEAPGFVTVPWDAVDAWYEEGRRLVHYPPNPYHRVDCRPTRRRLKVTVRGVTLVGTDDTVAVFETALPPRLYVHRHHVRNELLHPSATSTYCNYKGSATWWSAIVDGAEVADVAWSYEDPPDESRAIAGHLCFDDARADVHAELPVSERGRAPAGR